MYYLIYLLIFIIGYVIKKFGYKKTGTGFVFIATLILIIEPFEMKELFDKYMSSPKENNSEEMIDDF